MDSKLAKEWFESADSDFQYAEVGLKSEEVFPQVAFLSQQVVEKYLKGYLVFNGVKPTRVHELPKLLDECVKVNSDLEKLRDACELPTGFYVETRYPPNIPEYTKEEIAKAFKNAKLVRKTVEVLIQV